MRYPKFEYTKYIKVAVVGNCTRINTFLEKKLISYDKSPYTVIERSRLETILQEQGLGVVLDAQSVARLGKIPGVDALVITECGGGTPSMRFVDTTTGVVLAVETSSYGDYAGLTAEEFYASIGPHEYPWRWCE
jgi:hypothetical protein